MKVISTPALWCFVCAAPLSAQVLIIPQVADGGGWQTTFVLANTTTSQVPANLTCRQETTGGATQPWSLPLLENVSAQNLSLPGAGTLFLHTPGTASVTSIGWCQIQAPAGVTSYSIFTSRAPGAAEQDGTAPAAFSASRILVPYDNSSSSVTSVALVNTTGATETIGVGFQSSTGAISQTSLSIPAMGHMAFSLPEQFSNTSGQTGLAEFSTSAGGLSIIALRFNPTGGFTAAPVYPESGPAIIGGGSAAPFPVFTSISLTTTFTPNNQVNYPIGIFVKTPMTGGYAYGLIDSGLTATAPAPTVIGFEAFWTNVTFNGGVLTFSGLQPGAQTAMVDNAGKPYSITSASLALTLVPQGTGLTGTASGSLTLISSLATLTGTVSGTYVGNQ